jgi:hypothetical protein
MRGTESPALNMIGNARTENGDHQLYSAVSVVQYLFPVHTRTMSQVLQCHLDINVRCPSFFPCVISSHSSRKTWTCPSLCRRSTYPN